MTKFLYLFVFCTAFGISQAQNVDDTFVIGKWKVKKATALKDADKPETKELLKGFQKAIYVFNADHSFSFDTKSKEEMMGKLEKMFNNKNWVVDSKKKKIKVGLKKEGYSTLIFQVKLEKETVIFLIEDANIELVMKKSS